MRSEANRRGRASASTVSGSVELGGLNQEPGRTLSHPARSCRMGGVGGSPSQARTLLIVSANAPRRNQVSKTVRPWGPIKAARPASGQSEGCR